MANIAGVILAGGKSSRMGKDKIGLRLHDKTLLEHMAGLLHDAGIRDVYISHKDFVQDNIPGYGPLSGIHTLLKHVQQYHQHLIFMPIDMPGLTSSLTKQLISAPENAPLVHFEFYKMPFRLSTDKQWLESAETLLRTGDDVSLGNFQKSIPNPLLMKTTPTEQGCFQNINTPEEWHMFKEEVQS